MAQRSSPLAELESTASRLAEEQELVRQLDAARDELRTLYAALDNVESGLLLLDGELRARYGNPALHALFKNAPPQFIREARPKYQFLLSGAQNISDEIQDDYVERRLNWVRAGGSDPMDIKMGDGKVVRCHVTCLPEGGRMLIYSDVTDIVRAAEELERLATVDGMTGIYNRRHFLNLADREWERARRYQRPISFLMIDIDHFKNINDSFGHQVGDAVIVHLAEVARGCKRDADVLARVGGEEFALLLPETGLEEAMIVAERLRVEVSQTKFPLMPAQIESTISIGAASAADHMREFSILMRTADEALYEAKRRGRNRVVCLDALPPTSIEP
ncbi:MAG TPA: diguanylate cyclase [Rhizobiaceae bacterium]|nr:diguanylate cyclase [Rhizobiaceae bacterium]